MKINLKERELGAIEQVIGVPLYASGSEELEKKTGLRRKDIIKIQQNLAKLFSEGKEGVQLELSEKDLKNLIEIFSISVYLAKNFDDIHTLTGYEEEEFDSIMIKLRNLLK